MRSLLGLGALLVLVIVACGDEVATPRADADADADAAAQDEPFTTIRGVKCCREGTGESCCHEDGSCREARACSGPGGVTSAKIECSACCPGLVAIGIATPDGGTCDTPSAEAYLCAACGDGVCDDEHGENRCNCEADCR